MGGGAGARLAVDFKSMPAFRVRDCIGTDQIIRPGAVIRVVLGSEATGFDRVETGESNGGRSRKKNRSSKENSSWLTRSTEEWC